jgi:hypothetical protein
MRIGNREHNTRVLKPERNPWRSQHKTRQPGFKMAAIRCTSQSVSDGDTLNTNAPARKSIR